MKTKNFSSLCVVFLFTSAVAGQSGALSGGSKDFIVERYGRLPLAFEANQGQTDLQVKFFSRGTGCSLFLTSAEAVLSLRRASGQRPGSSPGESLPPTREEASVLRMRLVGANPKAEVTGQDELPGKSNYFIGNDPTKWHTSVPQYAKVHYQNVYPGVDLVYYGNQLELEYDFVLKPGADPNLIRLAIEGASKVRLNSGDLVLTSSRGNIHLRLPHLYQIVSGVKHEIRGGYVMKGKDEVGFRVASYDRRRVLVIDPVLAYSTYLGGSSVDQGYAITVDMAGNAYVVGYTSSADFPTANAIQSTYRGNGDLFVTKSNADGSALVYSTYLGGSNVDYPNGVAVDTTGNTYLTGYTQSADFPTVSAIQPTFGGNYDAFVTKINAAGSALVYSTYLGGVSGDSGSGIAADSAGNAYVTGYTQSNNFPTANALQPTHAGGGEDAFVTKINATGTALVYSTYLGGNGSDVGGGIATDPAGDAYITGGTTSTNFPTANPIQAANQGDRDVFVTKLNATGSALVYSTYLGGYLSENGTGIAPDAADKVYVVGITGSPTFLSLMRSSPHLDLGIQMHSLPRLMLQATHSSIPLTWGGATWTRAVASLWTRRETPT